jgi:hypothetical protein
MDLLTSVAKSYQVQRQTRQPTLARPVALQRFGGDRYAEGTATMG